MSTIYQIVKSVIDDWDLIDLLCCTQKDEYDPEIRRIVSALDNKKNASDLGKIIYMVFDKMFRGFPKSEQECQEIAKRILDKL